MAERPAPLVLVAQPTHDLALGSHAAIAADGQRLLAAELSWRLESHGAAVSRLPFRPSAGTEPFDWGHWFSQAARQALAEADALVGAIGYAGAGALALLREDDLEAFLSPRVGEVIANNRFSADGFVVAGDLPGALDALEACETDNAAPRALDEAGFAWRDLEESPWARFDVDTTMDLALLRLATRLEATRTLDRAVADFLETARLPGDRPLEVPNLDGISEVVRSRSAELVVAGRVPGSTWRELETETACRVRGFIEERGMRSAPGRGTPPRSVLATVMDRSSPAELVDALAALGDAVVLDTRVLMAAVTGSSDASRWPPREERFASDFGDATRIGTPWLRELVDAAARASVPFVLGGHALVSDGIRLIVAAAWQGR